MKMAQRHNRKPRANKEVSLLKFIAGFFVFVYHRGIRP
jgi:hypothetical protein